MSQRQLTRGAGMPPWAAAVRREEIEGRKLITDQAIIDAILTRSPRSAMVSAAAKADSPAL